MTKNDIALDSAEAEAKREEDRKTRDARLNRAISKAVKAFKSPEQLTVSEWADKHRRLSPESSAEVGLWRTSRTPYLKDIMDAFTDPKVRHIVVSSSSQVGKSEVMNNMIGYVIDQDPGSILYIHPTTIDAKEYSKLRIAPMIRDCPRLKSKVADPKSRDSANTMLQKSYPGGILTMCGSTEAHALASKPIRYIFGDERDRWASSAGNEGDPWELASARQITFYNAKSVEVSTPTIKGASAIEAAYAGGTMERWKSRCPHCGEYHEIIFEHIRFEKEETVVRGEKTYKLTSLFYVCPGCGGISTESEIKKAPARWEAENPEAYSAYGTRSFWLSSWVSPWASWSSTIIQYLKAIGNSKKLQVVYNTRFGQLWEERGDIEDEESVMARREDYAAELPDGVLCLTCGIDTQDDRMEYEVVGHGHFGETWGIKRGFIMGRPDSDEVWASIDGIINHVYRFSNGKGLHISITFVDSGGHFTQEVYAACRMREGKRVFAIKGIGGESVPYTSPPKHMKITKNNTVIGSCKLFEIGVDAGKAIIMDNLKVQTPGSHYCHFPRREDYGEAYFKGLLSEHLVYKANAKNHWQWEKIPGHERNESLDCRNYAIAGCKAISPNFDAIEAKLRATPTTSNTPVATGSTRQAQRQKASRRESVYNEW